MFSDDLLKEKTTNLLVLVSGRVASATTFNSKDGDLLGVVFENTVRLFFFVKLAIMCA